MQKFCYQSCPAGLVAGANAAAIVAMKIFVKQDVVAEMRVVLELFILAENRPRSIAVSQEDVRKTA